MGKYPLLGGQLHGAGQNPGNLLEKADIKSEVVFCSGPLVSSGDSWFLWEDCSFQTWSAV